MELILLSGIILAVLILTFIMVLMFWPGEVLKACLWSWCVKVGMPLRYAVNGSYQFCYCSHGTPGGDVPSVLLLHGFSGCNGMWLPIVQHFPKSWHVVCLDLPAHGGTSRTGPEDYTIQGQVRRVHQFVHDIGLNKRPFHLVGVSMGGSVAGVYTAHYPSHVTSLTLICPAGLIYPAKTKFWHRLEEILLEMNQRQREGLPHVISRSAFMELYDFVLKPSRFNIAQKVMTKSIDNPTYREVFTRIHEKASRYMLQENLHLIRAPVQVVWGKQDQVLHVSGAAVLQAALPNCQVELIDGGHLVIVEQPGNIAKIIMDFVSAQEGNGRRH